VPAAAYMLSVSKSRLSRPSNADLHCYRHQTVIVVKLQLVGQGRGS